MIKVAFISCLLYTTFTGCDPARRITMKNNSADTAQIIWTASDDSIGFNPFVLNNSKDLKFVLLPRKKEISLSFGTGSWTPEYLQRFMRYLVSLEIVHPGHPALMLTTPQEINSFLLAHRKGNSKNKIEIVVPAR